MVYFVFECLATVTRAALVSLRWITWSLWCSFWACTLVLVTAGSPVHRVLSLGCCLESHTLSCVCSENMWLTSYMIGFLFSLFWSRVSCSLSCPRACYVAKDDLELTFFLLPPPQLWYYRHELSCLIYGSSNSGLPACMLGKLSTNSHTGE